MLAALILFFLFGCGPTRRPLRPPYVTGPPAVERRP